MNEQDRKAMRELRKLVGNYAYRRLQMGKATLQQWRGSTPHNWFVQSSTGNMLWHRNEYGPIPNRSLFRLASETKEKIAPSFVHSAGGLSFGSTYVLRDDLRQVKGTGQ